MKRVEATNETREYAISLKLSNPPDFDSHAISVFSTTVTSIAIMNTTITEQVPAGMDEQKQEPQEFSIEPSLLTDFTVHFGSTSFHLHRFVLSTQSKYFSVLLSPDELRGASGDCRLTERCRQPGHRCVSLPGTQIGGQEVTVGQLQQFFEYLSCGINQQSLVEWRKQLKVGDFVDYQNSGEMWKCVEIMHMDRGLLSVKNQADTDSGDVLIRIDSARLQQAYSVKPEERIKWQQALRCGDFVICRDIHDCWYLSCVTKNEATRAHIHYVDWETKWDEWVDHASGRIAVRMSPWQPFHMDLDFETSSHLANYFECDETLQKNCDRAFGCSKELVSHSQHVWSLLSLADRHHWGDLRSSCIDRIISTDQAQWSDQWQSNCDLVSRSTLTKLFNAAMTRRSL